MTSNAEPEGRNRPSRLLVAGKWVAVLTGAFVLGITLNRLVQHVENDGAIGSQITTLMVMPPGDSVPIEWRPSADATALLIFDPECPHCEEQKPGWGRLASGAARMQGFEVLALSTRPLDQDGLDEFASYQVHYLGVLRPADLTRTLGVTGVPFLAVVERDGTVARILSGLQDDASLTRLMKDYE